MLVIRTALIAIAATVVAGGALAQSKPATRKPVQTAIAARQDQSYLYLSPSSAPRGKLPDYAVVGSSSRDQVFVGTMFDNLGPTGLRR